MNSKKPIRVPLWFVMGILIAGAFFAGYYSRPTQTTPVEKSVIHTTTIASANKAVVATISSASVFISDVQTEGAVTTTTMSNGDIFVVNGTDLSVTPKEDLNLKCSDAIVVTPELMVMTCKGAEYDLNFAWNKQQP